MSRRSAHPTGGRDLVILSGGPRSRRVYFADEIIEQQRIELEAGRPWPYRPTKRIVAVGEIHQHVQDERLAESPATVWEHAPQGV